MITDAKTLSRLVFAGLVTVLAGYSTAFTQDLSTYDTVRYPEKFDIDWAEFYRQADADTAAVREALPHHLNLAFGQHPKQHLDLYLPGERISGAPVFLFFHGGGFREGDRAHYGFVAAPFARHGIITAIASYRLAGAGHQYPAPLEDAREAVEWLYEHVSVYGGDPMALYVGGHSAGGILAAQLASDRSWLSARGIPADSLDGMVPVSGFYDLTADELPGYIDAYASTPDLRGQASPISQLDDAVPAAVVAAGSLERQILDDSRQFAEALAAHGAQVDLMVLKKADHKDTVLALATESSPLFSRVLEMIRASREVK